MALTLTDCTDGEHWNRFVADSPHGSVFCLTPFLDALQEEYRLLFVEEKGSPQAGLVLLLRDGQPYPGQYPFTLYQGVLLGADLCSRPPHHRTKQTLEVVGHLMAALEAQYRRLALCQHYRFEDLRGFSWFHYHEPERGQFRLELQYSGLLDLAAVANFDAYLGSIRTVRRQEYRRCQGHGFSVQPSRDLELLDRLHQQTFARQGIERDPHDVRLLQSISRAALENGLGEVSTCVAPSGEVASATLFLFDQRCGYYLVSANDPEHRNSGSGTYLMIENIRRCQSKGLQAVDFVGVNSPNRGDFKTSFNAVPVPYFILTWEWPS
ncbi:MAG TPA: GNAT family N-acetyltransferase [Gemmataceae bacterium]|nr:GNAT family N-acetyltransferase [Gemmataceae bacterium]